MFAQRYDGIRFDVAWAYITPKISYFDNRVERPNFKDSILTFIEKTVKEVKGEKFNSNDLIHEFEADPADFQPFHGSTPRPELKNRVSAYSTRYMKSDWGSNDVFLRRGWTPDELLVGVGNHDPLPLRQLAELSDPLGHENLNELKLDKNPQIGELARILSLDEDTLRQNPIEFIKAKFAEPMMAKNNMVFYMDVFGKKERFNSQSHNNRDNFRHKIADSFETDYHKAVQSGFGFNLMDSYEKIFKAQNLDMDHKTLYGQIVKFRDILLEVGSGIKTPEVKNRSAKSVWIVGGIIAAAGSIAALYPKKLKQEQAVVVAPVSNLNYQHNVDKAKFLK